MITVLNDFDLQMCIKEALKGNREALNALIERIHPLIYNLAIRMLQNLEDAEDAVQEILMKVISHLDGFRGEAAFTTWVYRIASNHLLTLSQHHLARQETSFEEMEEKLNLSLALGEASVPEQYEFQTLVAEVKISCSLAMLMCLGYELRIALILGEIFQVNAAEAAYILDISSTAYRKRLSRARMQLRTFIRNQCGLVNPENPCRCSKHVGNKLRFGLLNPNKLAYTDLLNNDEVKRQAAGYCEEMEEVRREIGLIRAIPQYEMPLQMLDSMKQLLNNPQYPILHHTPTDLL